MLIVTAYRDFITFQFYIMSLTFLRDLTREKDLISWTPHTQTQKVSRVKSDRDERADTQKQGWCTYKITIGVKLRDRCHNPPYLTSREFIVTWNAEIITNTPYQTHRFVAIFGRSFGVGRFPYSSSAILFSGSGLKNGIVGNFHSCPSQEGAKLILVLSRFFRGGGTDVKWCGRSVFGGLGLFILFLYFNLKHF